MLVSGIRHIAIGFAAFASLAVAGCVLEYEDDPSTGEREFEVLTAVTWTDLVGVSATGNSLTKTGANGWNAGAASVETLGDDGAVEFTSAEATTAKMAGLSNGNGGFTYADIDFAFFLTSNGWTQVYEAGTLRGTFGKYVAGDIFRIEVTGSVVTYRLLTTGTLKP